MSNCELGMEVEGRWLVEEKALYRLGCEAQESFAIFRVLWPTVRIGTGVGVETDGEGPGSPGAVGALCRPESHGKPFVP